jgi:hypothetical protein
MDATGRHGNPQGVSDSLAKVGVAGSVPVVRSRGAGRPLLHETAGWPSGQAAACKAAYTGSIPVPASRMIPITGA